MSNRTARRQRFYAEQKALRGIRFRVFWHGQNSCTAVKFEGPNVKCIGVVMGEDIDDRVFPKGIAPGHATFRRVA